MKSLFEQMGGTYTLGNDGYYYYPDLELPTQKDKPIGIWGQRHLRYIKQHRRVFYTNLLTSGKLNEYLADLNDEAETMFSRLINDMSKSQGITEHLKAENQLAWVGAMNNIRNRAMEIVNAELIYTI